MGRTRRSLVRIVSVSEDDLTVVVPGWDPHHNITMPRSSVPPEIEVYPGKRLHAQVCLSALNESCLGFCSWEAE